MIITPAEEAAGVLVLLHGSMAAYTIGRALLTVRDPRAAWGWIAACLLAPLAGPLLYLMFGTNRVKASARRLLGASQLLRVPRQPPGLEPMLAGVSPEELRELVRIAGVMTQRSLESGNRLAMLQNGEAAYPAMLEAIGVAKRRVWLSSYIFSGRGIGLRFVEALAAAQARGADVRVLIDGVGDLYYFPRASAKLRRLRVPVRRFQLPRRFLPFLPHLNLRNHRKLLIVDEDLVFTGGINIGDHQFAQGRRKPTLDLHFRLQGPITAQLAQVFADDWAVSGRETSKPLGINPIATRGNSYCRAITEGPNEEVDRLELVLLGMLANAHQRVCIMTPYFIPMPELARAMEAAALRGVEVQLVLPARSNLFWVDYASRRWQRDLLARGVRVFLRPAPFAHSKLLVMDDYYSHIGSANIDPRSLRLNFELVVETYCRDFTRELSEHCDQARAQSRELSLQELDSASRWRRLRDAICWLFSPYL